VRRPARAGGKARPVRRNAARPNAARPNVARPNVARPNVARPNAARPNAARPNAARPNAARKEVARNDGARLQSIAAARAADEKLGEKVVILDVRDLTSLADCMVITSVSSPPHMKAVTDAMEEAVEQVGGRLHHREGGPDSPWVLLDFGILIVHVFTGPAREYYDLERLWSEGHRVAWRRG